MLVQLQDLEDSRRIIPDFPIWSQCFTIFVTALTIQQPERLPHLMAYQYQMAAYAKKFRWPTWVMYDQNYRQEKAATQDNNWSQISTAIYAQCFMTLGVSQEDWCKTCYTLDHTTTNCPRSLHPPRGTRGKRAAYHKGPVTITIQRKNTAQDNTVSSYTYVSNAEGSTHNLSVLNETQEELTSEPAKGSVRTAELKSHI